MEGRPTARYLWEVKHVVPFLKVDKGLAEAADGGQVMKPIPDLDELLERAVANRVFGTKMRSVITLADAVGVGAVVGQQFDIAHRILDTGLVPIIEPEIDIHSPQKSAAETLLLVALLGQLDRLDDHHRVMIKLTPPETDDLYTPLVAHPRVLRIVALSGGYPREEANARLARQHGVVASFSRALTEGLSVDQSDSEFDATLGVDRGGLRRVDHLRVVRAAFRSGRCRGG